MEAIMSQRRDRHQFWIGGCLIDGTTIATPRTEQAYINYGHQAATGIKVRNP